jgi:chromate reductase, NAD(P)H dehydrogenase (quinone)
MPRIIGISGSLRDGSHNTGLLRAAATALPPGVELDIFAGLRAVPPSDTDRDVELPIRRWQGCATRSPKPTA